MRMFAAALTLALAAPVFAADKNEDKAKETAVAFLKAVKAKDADAVLKVSAVPFAHKEGDDVSLLKDAAELKKWVKERLEQVDADKVPTELDALHPFAEVKEKIKDEKQRKQLEELAGKEAFVGVISVDGNTITLLVRIKDGKAAVVGAGH
ncbi:hypothetical protein R5W24_001508 [Gemmata sp. JC717]|uniref:hypothetical protein n=1 Tax=Gemmata algarum TaxID=2975278 RepID=UPI0021BB56FF|nr:hypothetical protein [Gemmata algarum]MDY3552426.1 hypothetical protein [Gemmata algarum]